MSDKELIIEMFAQVVEKDKETSRQWMSTQLKVKDTSVTLSRRAGYTSITLFFTKNGVLEDFSCCDTI